MDSDRKKHIVCTNCGKLGHEFKACNDAITSFGIINFKIPEHSYESNMLKEKFSTQKNFYLKITSRKYSDIECYFKDTNKKFNPNSIYTLNDNGVLCPNDEFLKKFYYYRNKIKFLMISRKFSLGFIEFLRGKYDLGDTVAIVNLFQQMTEDEIKIISKNNYNDILFLFLNRHNENKASVLNKIYDSKYSLEYHEARIKFNMLVNPSIEVRNLVPYTLDFYVKNIKPKWKEPEWGFPKGRRDKRYEENLTCACREFEEETGITSDNYDILNKIEPIEENLIGTNGVCYKHVYYLSINNYNTNENFHKYDKHEIGLIKWFTYDEAISVIRPYHKDKQCVLTKVYLFILNQLLADI
jgi:8-oxo-dGTP pyrophosphatase MutT (NUDIX family)